MGRMTSHILWKIKNVPNHQQNYVITFLCESQCLFCTLSPKPLPSDNNYLISGISTPLKNDGVHQLGWWLFPTKWKNESHVPNHQPVILITQIKNYHISHHFLFLSWMELQSWGVNMIAPRFSPELWPNCNENDGLNFFLNFTIEIGTIPQQKRWFFAPWSRW